jgi:diguanylate cyclase (GGDEF)-like protein
MDRSVPVLDLPTIEGMPTHDDRRLISYSAAGISGGAAFLGVVEALIPGGQTTSIVPGIGALAMTVAAVVLGPRVPRPWLVVLGFLGAALIAFALATTHAYGDGALLYAWPVLWTAGFFGNRATVLVVVWIGLVHGLALLSLPDGQASVDRWIDVTVSVSVVAVVVRLLAARNARLVARLSTEARIDPLTGLLNRRGFDERLGVELARAERDDTSIGVVAFDLDHFKRVNDLHGHETGDRVLSWLGAVLTEHVRGVDLAARVGGEEFAIVLVRSDAAEAAEVADRVRRAIATPDLVARGRFGIAQGLALSISAGVAASRSPFDALQLMEDADRALYAAKRRGRDQVVVAQERERFLAGVDRT